MIKPKQPKNIDLTRAQKALRKLTPLNRVHAGPDMSRAYRLLQDFYPNVEIFGYESGTNSGNWSAPPGWIVHYARLIGPDGNVILDWHRDSILCIYSYSPSFEGVLSLQELEEHLFSNPHHPDGTPYYFRNMYRFATGLEWGFCLPHNVRQTLPDGDYTIEIKTEFPDAPMEMAMKTKKGEHPESLLLVGHFDHPAQCGDGLLGCIAGHEILESLSNRDTKLTYRMLSTVEIVGSVFYAESRAEKDQIKETLFTALSGVDAPLVYACSVSGNSNVDGVMRHILMHEEEESSITHFRGAAGNDETAFDVQGVNIPSGSLMRYPYEHYHTSFDTDDKVNEQKFKNFISIVMSVIDVFEQNATLKMTHKGLPCLSHPDIDLYLSPLSMSGLDQAPNQVSQRLLNLLPNKKSIHQARKVEDRFNQVMNLLPALADGNLTTLELAERTGVPFALIHAYTELWVEKGLMEKKWVHPFKS